MPGQVTSGMDIGQVRQLATLMTQSGDQINQIVQKITAQLGNTPWLGPDRQKFEADWNSQMQAQLRQVTQALQQAAQRATQNATQQEQASAN